MGGGGKVHQKRKTEVQWIVRNLERRTQANPSSRVCDWKPSHQTGKEKKRK